MLRDASLYDLVVPALPKTTKNYQIVLDEIFYMASNKAWFDSINRA